MAATPANQLLISLVITQMMGANNISTVSLSEKGFVQCSAVQCSAVQCRLHSDVSCPPTCCRLTLYARLQTLSVCPSSTAHITAASYVSYGSIVGGGIVQQRTDASTPVKCVLNCVVYFLFYFFRVLLAFSVLCFLCVVCSV